MGGWGDLPVARQVLLYQYVLIALPLERLCRALPIIRMVSHMHLIIRTVQVSVVCKQFENGEGILNRQY